MTYRKVLREVGILLFLTTAVVGCVVLVQYCLGIYEDYKSEKLEERRAMIKNLSWHEAGHLVVAWHVPSLAVPALYTLSDFTSICRWSQMRHSRSQTYEALEHHFGLAAAATGGAALEQLTGRPPVSVRVDMSDARQKAMGLLKECDRIEAGGDEVILNRLRRRGEGDGGHSAFTVDREMRALKVLAKAKLVAKGILQKRLPQVDRLAKRLSDTGNLERSYMSQVLGNRTKSLDFSVESLCL